MDMQRSVLVMLSIYAIHVIAGLPVSIDEAGQDGTRTVEEGSNLNLTCRVHTTARRASEITWYKTVHGEIIEQPKDKYTANDNTSVLTLQNIRGNGLGQYYHCGFERNLLETIVLYVGIIPKPPDVQCFSRDQVSYWCEYSEKVDTGLKSSFSMEYKAGFGSYAWSSSVEDDWIRCYPQEETPNKCFVSNSEWDHEHHVRVNQTNPLGTGSTTVKFSPMEDAIPGPVSDSKIKNVTSRTLKISWNKPAEWNRSALKYKITYTAFGASESKQLLIKHSSGEETRTLESLLPYANYSIEIQSQGYVYDGPEWSESVFLTGETLQEAPELPVQNLTYTNTTAKEDAYKRDVIMKWKEVPEMSRHGLIIGYSVHLESDIDGITTAWVHDRSYKRSGLDKFHDYNVSVAALTIAGEGPHTTVVLPDLTTAPMPPEIEQGFPIARSTSSIEVRWKEPENPQGYIEYYLLKWSDNKADWESKKVNRSRLSYNVTSLKDGTEYYFQLGVKNKKGLGMSDTINQPVRTKKNEKGIDSVVLLVSILGGSLVLIVTLFFIYWFRNTEITKPGPEICISEKAMNFEVGIYNTQKTKEIEVFDNIDEPPPYNDYVMEPFPVPVANVAYQNAGIKDERREECDIGSPSGSSCSDFIVGDSKNRFNVGEGESVYRNVSTDTMGNYGTGKVAEEALLKPKLNHTSSGNVYTNLPEKSRSEKEDVSGSGNGSDKEDYATRIPNLGEPKYCNVIGK